MPITMELEFQDGGARDVAQQGLQPLAGPGGHLPVDHDDEPEVSMLAAKRRQHRRPEEP